MTKDVREQKFYEVSLQLLSLRRLFRHLEEMPFAGFPAAHMVSLMSQLPVRQGMKIAYAKWQANKGVRQE